MSNKITVKLQTKYNNMSYNIVVPIVAATFTAYKLSFPLTTPF